MDMTKMSSKELLDYSVQLSKDGHKVEAAVMALASNEKRLAECAAEQRASLEVEKRGVAELCSRMLVANKERDELAYTIARTVSYGCETYANRKVRICEYRVELDKRFGPLRKRLDDERERVPDASRFVRVCQIVRDAFQESIRSCDVSVLHAQILRKAYDLLQRFDPKGLGEDSWDGTVSEEEQTRLVCAFGGVMRTWALWGARLGLQDGGMQFLVPPRFLKSIAGLCGEARVRAFLFEPHGRGVCFKATALADMASVLALGDEFLNSINRDDAGVDCLLLSEVLDPKWLYDIGRVVLDRCRFTMLRNPIEVTREMERIATLVNIYGRRKGLIEYLINLLGQREKAREVVCADRGVSLKSHNAPDAQTIDNARQELKKVDAKLLEVREKLSSAGTTLAEVLKFDIIPDSSARPDMAKLLRVVELVDGSENKVGTNVDASCIDVDPKAAVRSGEIGALQSEKLDASVGEVNDDGSLNGTYGHDIGKAGNGGCENDASAKKMGRPRKEEAWKEDDFKDMCLPPHSASGHRVIEIIERSGTFYFKCRGNEKQLTKSILCKKLVEMYNACCRHYIDKDYPKKVRGDVVTTWQVNFNQDESRNFKQQAKKEENKWILDLLEGLNLHGRSHKVAFRLELFQGRGNSSPFN